MITKKCFLITLSYIVSMLVLIAVFVYRYPFKAQQHFEINQTLVQPSYRLPNNLEPTYYNVRIIPAFNNFTFSGRVQIILNCIEPTNYIILHAESINITNVVVTKTEYFYPDELVQKLHLARVLKITVSTFTHLKGKLALELKESLQSNREYYLDVSFEGIINDENLGLYRSYYIDEQGYKRWLITTQMQPTHARKVFPCFDEPKFKAKFQINIARKTDMISLSNMPKRNTTRMELNTTLVWDQYLVTPVMPTYLLAFTVTDMKSVNVSSHQAGPVIKIWTAKHQLKDTKYAVDITTKIMHFFQKYLRIKYPLSKLDLISVPHLINGAMENWGLISFRGSSLLLNENTNNIRTRKHIFNKIAHELAHQWFGNLVTIKWWDDLWLNEGFATYMANVAEIALKPEWDSFHSFGTDITQLAMKSDTANVHSLHLTLRNCSEIDSIFDSIVYNKGAALLRMVNYTIGEKHFKTGIENFLENWAYNSTTELDLWESFEYEFVANITLTEMMGTWTLQNGFPLITVNRNNSTLMFNQVSFHLEHYKQKWIVPLSYITEHDRKPKHVILSNSVDYIELNDNGWVLFNLHQTGYYRVNYDYENWNLLIKQLQNDKNKIPVANRAQLIDDAFALANAGHLNYTVIFKLVDYLKRNETNKIPWKAAFENLNFIEEILMDTKHFGIYSQYVSKLISSIENSHIKVSDDELILMFEEKKCYLKLPNCIFYKAYEDIPNDMKEVFYCTIINKEGSSKWESFWQKTLLPETSESELRMIYAALGCTKESWLIYRYLEETLNKTIKFQNIQYVWRSVAKHSISKWIALDFLEINWLRIYETHKNNVYILEAIIEEFLGKLSGESNLNRVLKFVETNNSTLSQLNGKLDTALEEIKEKLSWKGRFMNVFLNLLREYTI